MSDSPGHDPYFGWSPPPASPGPAAGKRRRGKAVAALAGLGGVIAGVALAFSVGANASTTSSTASTTSSTAPSSSATAPSGPDGQSGSFPQHGTAAHEALEKPVTGANATKAQAAAVKSVGSGTAGAVTTDMTGKGYEVTVTKSDGSTVEVHLDASFAVEDHGPGGH